MIDMNNPSIVTSSQRNPLAALASLAILMAVPGLAWSFLGSSVGLDVLLAVAPPDSELDVSASASTPGKCTREWTVAKILRGWEFTTHCASHDQFTPEAGGCPSGCFDVQNHPCCDLNGPGGTCECPT